MDYGRDTGFSGDGISGNWGRGLADQAIWATEDEYMVWSREASVDTNGSYEVRPSQSQSGSDTPHKKSRNSQGEDVTSSNRSKAIGKMFHRTKLCCKFRAGTCPYVTNCNFAHSIEELRKPPPNWQEIMAAHEDERAASSEPREEFQIPSVGSGVDTQRSYKGRHCKKFYSEEGCPYGESCTYLHDEQSKARESDAISLGPGTGGGYSGAAVGSTLKPSNWKTRICNKWEMTGYCPFGSKCHFAHGSEELHRFGGTLPDSEGKGPSAPIEPKLSAVPSKHPSEAFAGATNSLPHSDSLHIGVPPQRASNVIQRTGQRPNLKRKGPDKISKVYGDWIDDL